MYIYNPLERRMERLNSLEDHKTEEIYCSNAGTLLSDSEQALHLALGNLNPFSLKRLDTWHPERDAQKSWSSAPKNLKPSKHKSIWHSNFKDHSPAKSKPKGSQASCALFFKKVDFVGQTIHTEIEANLRQELAKHTEAELFSIYSGKRKRSPSSSSSSDSCDETPSSPATSKSRHNPFAKEIQRSPVVCENGSLLRLLSPKKQESPLSSTTDDGRAKPETTRVNAIKRSIFAKEQVEVRSRFFSTQTPELQVEKELKVRKQQPETSVHCRQLQLESTESAAESPKPAAETNDNDEDEAIVLLSSCSDDSSSQSATLPNSQEAEMPVKTIQKLPPSARRIGLSKPKANKRATATAKLGENQTKLSMFGFQKRPVLK